MMEEIDQLTKLIDDSMVVWADSLLTKYGDRDIEFCIVILNDTLEPIVQDPEAVVPLEQRRMLNFEFRAYALAPVHHWTVASQFDGVPPSTRFLDTLLERVASSPGVLHTWTK